MKPSTPEGSNFTYTAPKGTEAECGDLHVRIGKDATFGQSITSTWEPNDDELDALYFGGGKIALTIFANQHPVVSVGVEGNCLNARFDNRRASASVRSALQDLQAALCDPGGKACFAGSNGDRALVDRGLSTLRKLYVQPHWDIFKEPPLEGVIGWAQEWVSANGEHTHTFDAIKDDAEGRLPVDGWQKVGKPFPVKDAR